MTARAETRRALCVVLLALLGVAWPGARAAAYCRLTTGMPEPGEDCSQQGAVLHWQRQCLTYSPLVRSADAPAFADIEVTLGDSFASWLEVECDGERVPLVVQQSKARARCGVPQFNEAAGNANSIVFVRDWAARDYPPEAFGLTLVWHDPKSGEILDADMMLNETMGEVTLCDVQSCPAGAVDVQNVVTHEAGHFLGLGHSYSRTSSMFFEARTGEVRKRFLNDDDRAGLCEIYAGFDPPACTGEDFEPAGGFRASCVTEGGCTVATAHSAEGRVRLGELAPGLLTLGVLAAWARRRRKSRVG